MPFAAVKTAMTAQNRMIIGWPYARSATFLLTSEQLGRTSLVGHEPVCIPAVCPRTLCFRHVHHHVTAAVAIDVAVQHSHGGHALCVPHVAVEVRKREGSSEVR